MGMREDMAQADRQQARVNVEEFVALAEERIESTKLTPEKLVAISGIGSDWWDEELFGSREEAEAKYQAAKAADIEKVRAAVEVLSDHLCGIEKYDEGFSGYDVYKLTFNVGLEQMIFPLLSLQKPYRDPFQKEVATDGRSV